MYLIYVLLHYKLTIYYVINYINSPTIFLINIIINNIIIIILLYVIIS